MELPKKRGKQPPSDDGVARCEWCNTPLVFLSSRICQVCAVKQRNPGKWMALSRTQPQQLTVIEVFEAGDAWDALHQGRNSTGIKIVKLEEITNPGVTITLLGSMCSAAEKLAVSKPLGKYDEELKGIDFHVAIFTVKSNSCKTVWHEPVTFKRGAAVCFENTIFPLTCVVSGGHLLIHQTKCPCTRCRTAFSAWARQLNCIIIVAFDDRYDDLPPDGILIFLPTGEIYYRH